MSGDKIDMQSRPQLLATIEELRNRLAEAEQTLQAIRSGEVDALIVGGPTGDQVFSLTGVERVYRVIVETMNEAALTVSPEGTILFCNRQFASLVQIPMSKAIGRKFADFVETAHHQESTDLISRALVEPTRTRLILRSADGHELAVQCSATSLPTESYPSVCLVVTDLSQIEAAADFIRVLEASQKETKESERKFRALFENSTNAVFLTTPEGSVLAANPAASAMLGWTEEELCGMSRSAIMDTNDPRLSQAIEERERTGSIHGWALTAIHKDGQRIPVEVDSTNIPGEPARSFVMWRDITERKQAEEALRFSEEKFRNIFRTSASLITISTLKDGRIIDANDAFTELLGFTREEVIGRTVREVWIWADLEERNRLAMRLEAEGRIKDEEITLKTKDGATRIVLLSAALVTIAGERCAVGSVSDITDRKKAEQALRQLNVDLENTVSRRTANLTAANRELEARAEQLRMLASELTMAEQRERKRLAQLLHDGLQQNLAAAKLQVGAIAGDNGQGGASVIAQVEQLLGDAIQMSRSLSAELSPPILYDRGLSPAIEWLAHTMKEQHGFSVVCMIPDEVELPEDVNVMLFHSVRELLFNSVKHSGVAHADVELQAEDGKLRITVSDAGVGFDPNSLGRTKNTGFGLFSIRERLALLGGVLKVNSAPGRGSHFTLMVPYLEGAVQKKQPQIETEETIRVLLVDDHSLFLDGLSRLCKRAPDLQVVAKAESGAEAIALAKELKPDVILMDVNMPGMNGIEATGIIHQRHPEIQIIGLSMHEDALNIQSMRQSGAIDYITKGCSATELIKSIRACKPSGRNADESGDRISQISDDASGGTAR